MKTIVEILLSRDARADLKDHTPLNPKFKNHNLDYHTIITSRKVMKTSEVIIKA